MKVKFMGSSHKHVLAKGDNFGGRLSEPLAEDVVFDRNNSWIVDSDEAGLSQEAVEILVGTDDFKDVSDLKRIPTNQHQQIFLGMKKTEGADVLEGDPSEDLDPEGEEPRGQRLPDEGSEQGVGTGASEVDAGSGGTTTVGGSTDGGTTTGGSPGGSTSGARARGGRRS